MRPFLAPLSWLRLPASQLPLDQFEDHARLDTLTLLCFIPVLHDGLIESH